MAQTSANIDLHRGVDNTEVSKNLAKNLNIDPSQYETVPHIFVSYMLFSSFKSNTNIPIALDFPCRLLEAGVSGLQSQAQHVADGLPDPPEQFQSTRQALLATGCTSGDAAFEQFPKTSQCVTHLLDRILVKGRRERQRLHVRSQLEVPRGNGVRQHEDVAAPQGVDDIRKRFLTRHAGKSVTEMLRDIFPHLAEKMTCSPFPHLAENDLGAGPAWVWRPRGRDGNKHPLL